MTHRENCYEKMFLDWDGAVVLNKPLSCNQRVIKTPQQKLNSFQKNHIKLESLLGLHSFPVW